MKIKHLDPAQFKRWLHEAVWLPSAAILILITLGLWKFQSLNETMSRVDHSDQVIAQGFLVERLMMDAENGLRGFILRRDQEMDEDFAEAVARIPNEFLVLKDLIKDSPLQLKRINKTEADSSAWLQLADYIHKSAQKNIDYRKVVAPKTGKHMMDVVRDDFDGFVDAERSLRDQRSHDAQSATRWAILMGIVVTVLFGAALAFRSRGRLFELTETYDRVLDDLQGHTDKLQHVNTELQNAISVRDSFLSIASHELKTPLTSLKLQLQLAARAIKPSINESPTPERMLEMLKLCLTQTGRLTGLIDDLLDVSRIQGDKLTYHFDHQVDLADVASTCVAGLADQFQMANCSIEFIENRPDEKVIVQCDRFRIEQVVINLLTNALKYGDGKPVKVGVRIDNDSSAVIEVKDHGVGIPSEKHAVIFERYERAADEPNISGLGLGLYISQQIIQAHHGSIEVQSSVGDGSTFSIRLPLVRT